MSGINNIYMGGTPFAKNNLTLFAQVLVSTKYNKIVSFFHLKIIALFSTLVTRQHFGKLHCLKISLLKPYCISNLESTTKRWFLLLSKNVL